MNICQLIKSGFIAAIFYGTSCSSVDESQLVWAQTDKSQKILDKKIDLIKVNDKANEILFWAVAEAVKGNRTFTGPPIAMEAKGHDYENDKKILIYMQNATLADVLDVVCHKMKWTYYVSYHAIIVRCDMSVDPAWKERKTWATDRNVKSEKEKDSR